MIIWQRTIFKYFAKSYIFDQLKCILTKSLLLMLIIAGHQIVDDLFCLMQTPFHVINAVDQFLDGTEQIQICFRDFLWGVLLNAIVEEIRSTGTWTCAIEIDVLLQCRWTQWNQIIHSPVYVYVRCWDIPMWRLQSSSISSNWWTTNEYWFWTLFYLSSTIHLFFFYKQSLSKWKMIRKKDISKNNWTEIIRKISYLIVNSSSIGDQMLGCSNESYACVSLSLSSSPSMAAADEKLTMLKQYTAQNNVIKAMFQGTYAKSIIELICTKLKKSVSLAQYLIWSCRLALSFLIEGACKSSMESMWSLCGRTTK